jgi:hypothetical protein
MLAASDFMDLICLIGLWFIVAGAALLFTFATHSRKPKKRNKKQPSEE